MTAKVGTPRSIPGRPKSEPATVIEIMTHIPESPIVPPRILGPTMLPSTCWMIISTIMKSQSFEGCAIRTRMPMTPAPMNGPKIGMMFVTATTSAIRG